MNGPVTHFSGRAIVWGPVAVPAFIPRPFAALLPAYDPGECAQVVKLSRDLVAAGCVELCCVGPQAESLHDSLDGVIEEMGAITVVTSWDTDELEACEYFFFAAGGLPPVLLALISDHPNLVAILGRAANGNP